MSREPAPSRPIYCCACAKEVAARLTTGREIYPRRPDLADLSFWRCDACRNYVGCHKMVLGRPRPLGVIPDAAIRNARHHIHAILDPLWKSGKESRSALYRRLGSVIGRTYHTADLRTLDEARAVYREIQAIAKEVTQAKTGQA